MLLQQPLLQLPSAPSLAQSADALLALHAVVAVGQAAAHLVLLGPGARAHLHAHDAPHRVEGQAQVRVSALLWGLLELGLVEDEGVVSVVCCGGGREGLVVMFA